MMSVFGLLAMMGIACVLFAAALGVAYLISRYAKPDLAAEKYRDEQNQLFFDKYMKNWQERNKVE